MKVTPPITAMTVACLFVKVDRMAMDDADYYPGDGRRGGW